MCIAFWYILPEDKRAPGKLRYILLFNREEWFARPTKPLELYERDGDSIICGLDVQAKGTWLAVNLKTGMLAFLTNRAAMNRKGLSNQISGFLQDLHLLSPKLSFGVKSRGALIMDLIGTKQRTDYCGLTKEHYEPPQNCPHTIEQSENKKVIEANVVQLNDPAYLDSLAGRTLLTRDDYRKFNLCFGSLSNLEFRTVGMNNTSIDRVKAGVGSFCNYVDLQEERLQKQEFALVEFQEIVDRFNDAHRSTDQLVSEVLALASEKFQSKESFFGNNNEEANLFLNPHQPYKKLRIASLMGEKFQSRARGTRTSTIVYVIDNTVKVIEQTYH